MQNDCEKEDIKLGLIYRVISPSGKIYIGKTSKDLEARKAQHIKISKFLKTKLASAIRKYGDQLIWEVLERNILILDLNERKKFYINLYNSNISGHNGTSGGDGGNASLGKEDYCDPAIWPKLMEFTNTDRNVDTDNNEPEPFF